MKKITRIITIIILSTFDGGKIMYRIKLDRVSRRRNIIRYQSFSMNESIEDMFYEDVSCSFFFFFFVYFLIRGERWFLRWTMLRSKVIKKMLKVGYDNLNNNVKLVIERSKLIILLKFRYSFSINILS